MEINRKLLVIAVWVFMAFGVAFASIPFIQSMSINEKAKNNLPRFYVKDLNPTEFKFAPSRNFDAENRTYLLYRNINSEVNVWMLPLYRGKVLMPDLKWWRYGSMCEDFGTEVDENKTIFTCLDKDIGKWEKREWRWDTNGTNLGELTEDMLRVPSVEKYDYVELKNYFQTM